MNEPRSGRVVSVNVNEGGVPKLPVDEQWVGSFGLADDHHLEPIPMHGGVDQAVCIYSVEAIDRLVAEGHNAFPGAFGENLTLEHSPARSRPIGSPTVASPASAARRTPPRRAGTHG